MHGLVLACCFFCKWFARKTLRCLNMRNSPPPPPVPTKKEVSPFPTSWWQCQPPKTAIKPHEGGHKICWVAFWIIWMLLSPIPRAQELRSWESKGTRSMPPFPGNRGPFLGITNHNDPLVRHYHPYNPVGIESNTACASANAQKKQIWHLDKIHDLVPTNHSNKNIPCCQNGHHLFHLSTMPPEISWPKLEVSWPATMKGKNGEYSTYTLVN